MVGPLAAAGAPPAAIVLASGSLFKAVAMIVFGMFLGMAGTDPNSPMPRLNFGVMELTEGIDFVAVAVGLFGLTEIMGGIVDQIRAAHGLD